MTDDRPSDDRWLTYIKASDQLGISPEAVRALARRQRWPRQRPNGIGQVVRVLVPLERLANGHGDADQRSTAPMTNGHHHPAQRSTISAANGHDQRSTGHGETAQEAIRSLGDAVSSLGAQLIRERERADLAERQIRDLQDQLTAERERADRAENRTEAAEDRAQTAEQRAQSAEERKTEAENRVRKLTEQLATEMTEHRQIVAALTARIPERRSWWRWRRQS